MQYDIAVIGNDEAAFRMLCAGAAAMQRVVAILPESRHSAWMMEQSLRRLVSNILADRSEANQGLRPGSARPRLLKSLLARSVADEVAEQIVILDGLGIDVVLGEARFVARNELAVSAGIDASRSVIRASNVVIGTGVRYTSMHRPLGLIPYHRPESLFEGVRLAESLCILGGGGVGAGLAALFSLFGVRSQLLARENHGAAMLDLARTAGVQVVFHPAELGIEQDSILSPERSDIVDCRRALGFTENLNLSVIGIEPDENGQLWCASSFETWSSGVFGIGEVVGFSPDTALSPGRQAERVLHRIIHRIPQPHFPQARARRSTVS